MVEHQNMGNLSIQIIHFTIKDRDALVRKFLFSLGWSGKSLPKTKIMGVRVGILKLDKSGLNR